MRQVWYKRWSSAAWLARHDKGVAALLLAVFTLLYFYPLLFGGEVLLGRDYTSLDLPMKMFWRESILGGEFPFWCPYPLEGTPFAACSLFSPVYPLQVLWLIFPPVYAGGVMCAAHWWVLMWFVYLLARECRLGVAGAWVAACCAFGSTTLLQVMEYVAVFTGAVWVPAILYFWLGLLRGGGRGKVIGLGVSGALMVSAGSPYPLLMTLITPLAVGLPFWLLAKQRAPLTVVLWRGALAFLLAFLLSAPHLLPTTELARQVPVDVLARNPQDQMFYSLLPLDWVKALAPTLYGFPMPSRTLYLGVLTMLLAAVAVALMVTRRWRWNGPNTAIVSLAVTGLALGCGPLLGIHHLLAVVPIIGRLYSYPDIQSIVAALGLPLLAGLTVRPLRRLSVSGRWWLAGVSLSAALLVLFCELPIESWVDRIRALPRYANDFKSLTAGPEVYPVLPAINKFLALWVCSLGAALLLACARRWRLALLAATVLLFADKALLMNDLRLFGKTNVYEVETASIRKLKELGADRQLARIHRTYHMMGETHILSGSNDPREFAWIRDFLPWDVGVPYHFYTTKDGCTLNITEPKWVWEQMLDRFEPWQNDRLRGLWNAKWIMDIQRGAGYSWRLRENPQFMPYAWLSSRALTVSDWREALRLLLDKDFDPRGTALLYASPAEVPEKLPRQNAKFIPIVAANLSAKIIVLEYLLFAAAGMIFAGLVSRFMLFTVGALLVMGIVYNVKPVRSKDIAYVDVLSESVNNAIRLLIGWLMVDSTVLPPASIIFGYWMGGAFLMGIKRFSEFRMINDPSLAGRYRRSFRFYTERSLLISSFFYAMLSVFFTGIFMIKYRIELLLLIPFLCGLFCLYLNLSYKDNSSAQRPEKLYKEKGLMFYILFFITLTAVLLTVDVPELKWFLESALIKVP